MCVSVKMLDMLAGTTEEYTLHYIRLYVSMVPVSLIIQILLCLWGVCERMGMHTGSYMRTGVRG